MVYLDTKIRADKAKKLFVEGLTARQIMVKLKASEPSVYRYFELVGGLSIEDKAKHYKNRANKLRKDK